MVTCRVLGFSPQASYKWRTRPVSDRDWSDAHLVDAARKIHSDDPVFGYRFIADELAQEHGIRASENRVQRLCSSHGILSVLARKKGRRARPGEPVHDDLVRRAFGAVAPNVLWFIDITEHPTGEGKPHERSGIPRGCRSQVAFEGCRYLPCSMTATIRGWWVRTRSLEDTFLREREACAATTCGPDPLAPPPSPEPSPPPPARR